MFSIPPRVSDPAPTILTTASCRSDRVATPALVLGFIIVLALSACTDARSPAAPEPSLAAPDVPALAVLDCSGSARGIKCVPAAAGARLGSGALGDRIIGGQDLYVRLTAEPLTNSFDDVNNRISQDVTVQDLTVQPFGTANWLSEAVPAVRVFFHSGPTNTGGTTGPVTVFNADGTATFTATNQPYFQYQEVIPANQKNQITKTWTFQLPGASTTFSFQVYVSAKVPDETTPLTIPPHTFTELSPGSTGYHSCGIRSGGTEYCWGRNNFGELGEATLTNRNTPAGVLGNVTLVHMVRGGTDSHTCGLTSAGAAYCWGYNGMGELGDGTTINRSIPVAVAGGLTFTALTAGFDDVCGLTSAGKAYCWGANWNGELGDGTTSPHSTPAAVGGGLTFTALFAGGYFTCGLTSAGAAYCWGANGYGQLGDGTNTERWSPAAVVGGFTFTTLVAGGFHNCGLNSAGTAYCWGNNGNGELGDGTVASRTTPTAVGGGFTFTSLMAGGYHTCGLTAGAAYCWGDNTYGELGDGTTTQRTSPTAVGGTFTTLAGGWTHSCGLTSAGTAYCWGDNTYGELGDGTFTQQWLPVAVLMP